VYRPYRFVETRKEIGDKLWRTLQDIEKNPLLRVAYHEEVQDFASTELPEVDSDPRNEAMPLSSRRVQRSACQDVWRSGSDDPPYVGAQRVERCPSVEGKPLRDVQEAKICCR